MPDTAYSLNITGGQGVINNLPISITDGTAITVEFWMYWSGGTNQMPFGFPNYDLYFYNGSFGFNTSNSDIYGIVDTGLVNTWVHIASVFYSNNYTLNKIYLNGVLQTLQQRLGTSINRPISTNATLSGWPTDANYRFNGYIDELRIWNKEQTQSQIVENMNKVLNPGDNMTGLIGNWRFDEGTGTMAIDSSPSNITMNLTGSTSWTTNSPNLQGYYKMPEILFENNSKTLNKGDLYQLKYVINKPSSKYNTQKFQMTEVSSTDQSKIYIYPFNKDDWDSITKMDIW